MADADPSTGSPFWRFSLGIYRKPGVGEACIALQDACGVDVNVLLFLLWLASGKRQLTADEVRVIDDKARGWRDVTVIPLRAVRRQLKSHSSLVEPAATEAFRNRVKAVELEAERLQQEALYDLSRMMKPGGAASATEAARANVAAYATALGKPFPHGAVETLLKAFADGN